MMYNLLAVSYTHLDVYKRQRENQSLAAEVWFDIVNSLAGAKFRPGLSLGQVKEEIHKYATQQKVLTLQEVSTSGD